MYKVPDLPISSINVETNDQVLTKFAQNMYSKYMYESLFWTNLKSTYILPKTSKMDHLKFLQINGSDDTYNVCMKKIWWLF